MVPARLRVDGRPGEIPFRVAGVYNDHYRKVDGRWLIEIYAPRLPLELRRWTDGTWRGAQTRLARRQMTSRTRRDFADARTTAHVDGPSPRRP